MPVQRVLTGDCREVLAGMEAASFDACVCDPPYDLTDVGRRFQGSGGTLRPDGGIRSESRNGGFMGARWDATGVAFDPETWWVVLRVLKPGGVLMAFGGTRTWHRLACAVEDAGFVVTDTLMWLHGQGFPKHKTLLKPAWEPVIVAKKPGAGGLRTEAGRIDYLSDADKASATPQGRCTAKSGALAGGVENDNERSDFDRPALLGRWPANVALDEEAAALLDAMSGESVSRIGTPRASAGPGDGWGMTKTGAEYADAGGASRFMYVAKADPAERTLPDGSRCPHPTMKPLALMQWLVRLACPPGGALLDPFVGSGTTLVACDREGVAGTGIDREPEYAEIARRRVVGDCPLFASVAD